MDRLNLYLPSLASSTLDLVRLLGLRTAHALWKPAATHLAHPERSGLARRLVPVYAALDPMLSLTALWPVDTMRAWRPSRLFTKDRRRRGLLIVLSGIEGSGVFTHCVSLAAIRSHWRGAVLDIAWGQGRWPLKLLRNVASTTHRARWAARLVRTIRRYRKRHADTPIHIISHSAGTGLAVEVLRQPGQIENTTRPVRSMSQTASAPAPEPSQMLSAGGPLPAGGGWLADNGLVMPGAHPVVDTCVLLSPALSPGYDLRPAARGCRQLISVNGPADWLWLGLGTSLAGGCDRQYGPTAGLVGFNRHNLPENFVERWWAPADLARGYAGNHCTVIVPEFLSGEIFPLLHTDRQPRPV